MHLAEWRRSFEHGEPEMTRRRHAVRILLLFVTLILGTTSCGAGGPDTSCSPEIAYTNDYGTVSIQQGGPNKSIQWGACPTIELAGTYTATVYRNGKKIDGPKVQFYPPHGSLMAGRSKAGDVIRVEGTFSNGEISQSFWLECVAA